MANTRFPSASDLTSEVTMRQVRYHIGQIMVQQEVPLSFQLNHDLASYGDVLLQRMVYQLKAYALKGEETKTTEHKYHMQPKTWWDHFKKDVVTPSPYGGFLWSFRHWFLRRFPIEFETIKFPHITTTAVRMCPHSNIKFQTHQRDMHFAFLDGGQSWMKDDSR